MATKIGLRNQRQEKKKDGVYTFHLTFASSILLFFWQIGYSLLDERAIKRQLTMFTISGLGHTTGFICVHYLLCATL